MNLEFNIAAAAPIQFGKVELDPASQVIHERAVLRGKKYLIAEAELLESIIEVDRAEIYKKFDQEYLTPYCIEQLGLSDNVAGMFVL